MTIDAVNGGRQTFRVGMIALTYWKIKKYYVLNSITQ